MSFCISLNLTEGSNNVDNSRPNPKPTPTPKPTATPKPTPKPTATPKPTPTATPTPTPTPPPAATKETFTWVSHVVNATVAQELYQMHFTDVAVRYVTEQEVVISQTNLAQYAIDLWLVVNPTLFKGDYAQNDFKVTLSQQSKGGVTNFIIDDANWLWYSGYFTTEAKNNFLYAMSSYGDKVLITLQEYDATWITPQGYSFAGLNVDLFNCPNIYHTSFDQSFNSKTLGIYLWCWDWNGTRPEGRDWDSITLPEIQQVYSLAKSCSAERMYVWLADEDNTVEAGMETSSLLNYSNWWSTITALNQAFLN
jgi:hypothetical protein